MKQLICIVCPKGCHLSVDEENGCAVTGNRCPRGAEYGANELKNPQRTLTTTVIIEGAARARLPVRTDTTVPKGRLFDCIRLTDGLTVKAPVKTGQVILENVAGTGANLVACCDMDRIV